VKLEEIETIARKVSRSVVEDLSNILCRVAESRKATVENREQQDPSVIYSSPATTAADDIAISLICDEILPPDSVDDDNNSNDDDDLVVLSTDDAIAERLLVCHEKGLFEGDNNRTTKTLVGDTFSCNNSSNSTTTNNNKDGSTKHNSNDCPEDDEALIFAQRLALLRETKLAIRYKTILLTKRRLSPQYDTNNFDGNKDIVVI